MRQDKFRSRIEQIREYLRKKKVPAKILFFVTGILSTIWFLVRVIPKPSRATYPCMKVAAPVMASFVIYLISLAGSVFALRKFKKSLLRAKYLIALVFLVGAVLALSLSVITVPGRTKAIELVTADYFEANQPMGVAYGIFPGRVVWVWDPDATDETCTNDEGDYWFENTDQAVVDSMLAKGVMNLTDQTTVYDAWDAMFKYFNNRHGDGETGYGEGEKIYIKINMTNSSQGMSGTTKINYFDRMDATPELCLSILKQLIEDVGVAQSDIYLGDPFRTFRDLHWDVCHTVYPDVNYCDGNGINGRHQTVPTTEHLMKFSDGEFEWRIPQEYVDATYFINMSCLKSHESGGITLASKNHQGSVLQDGASPDGQSAYDMHYSLPDHDGSEGGSYRYRHLVDYTGHEQLGGKTLVNIVDGIWAGRNWQGYVEKWQMEPFNNDYPNSLFLSQDNLAIESVGFDFLLTEYADKPSNQKYPYMEGTSDYLFQAADPDNWAPGVTYDPEGDGSPLGSLGVYEHWNNATDKQYTRNLETGDGIELVQVLDTSQIPEAINTRVKESPAILNLYPNPLNGGNLTVKLNNTVNSESEISITDTRGNQVFILRTENRMVEIPYSAFTPGTYLVKVTAGDNISVEKLVVE
jgi:hypothetical protein